MDPFIFGGVNKPLGVNGATNTVGSNSNGVKGKAKPFVGRLVANNQSGNSSVKFADPCDLGTFCFRYERARRLYNDRKWDELGAFLKEPRTRAWWVEPLVYHPEAFQAQKSYLDTEYFSSTQPCDGLVKVQIPKPGNRKSVSWVDVSKVSQLNSVV